MEYFLLILGLLLMIVGIIGENAIFTFLQFKENLHLQTVDESIEFAISTRLRPKLMTALGAIIALMPLALGIGAGALHVHSVRLWKRRFEFLGL